MTHCTDVEINTIVLVWFCTPFMNSKSHANFWRSPKLAELSRWPCKCFQCHYSCKHAFTPLSLMFYLALNIVLNRNLLSETFGECKWKEFWTSWKMICGFYSENVRPSKTAKITSIFFYPMTLIRSSMWVTLNMQIVSVAHRFIYAITFLFYPGALWFIFIFTFLWNFMGNL